MERVIGSGDPLPSAIKKNGLIMLWIIYLLGSFIGKNGLIIGNRFTALQKEPSGGWPNPRSLSIFLVSLFASSFTTKAKYYKRLEELGVVCFFFFSFLCALVQWRPAISTKNNIFHKITRPSFLIALCFSWKRVRTCLYPVSH